MAVTATLQVRGLGKRKLTALTEKAKRLGTTPERYVKRLVEEDLELDKHAANTTFEELLAPVRAQFKESGMTEEDLDRLVNDARTRHHQRVSRKSRRK